MHLARSVSQTLLAAAKRLMTDLDTVDSQATTGLRTAVVQFRDDGVVHILFLLVYQRCARPRQSVSSRNCSTQSGIFDILKKCDETELRE